MDYALLPHKRIISPTNVSYGCVIIPGRDLIEPAFFEGEEESIKTLGHHVFNWLEGEELDEDIDILRVYSGVKIDPFYFLFGLEPAVKLETITWPEHRIFSDIVRKVKLPRLDYL
tara:strand:- start:437 stop:781 length:345 start_codon:yes stop_codon:yes gene_type:complete